MKTESKIEIKSNQLRALQTTIILTAQHGPPYTVEEINDAARAANTIRWQVNAML